MSNPLPQPTPEQPSTLTLAAAEAYLIGLYVGAEAFLMAQVTRILKRMTPGVIGAGVARQQVRQVVRNVVGQLEQRTPPLVGQVVDLAGRDGWRSGGAGGSGGGGSHGGFMPPNPNPGFDPYELHGARAARAIRDDLTSELLDVRYRLTRLDEDVYKLIGPVGGAGQVLPNGFTPQQAQAKAWREFVARGITGFTDKSGRDWSLSAYTEMAVRTAAARSYNASRLQLLQFQGINLCFVDDTGHPCPLCFPWQGVILCITDDGEHPTVEQATAAGLFHPNCRHHLAAYFPGRTTLAPPQEWTPAHADAYKATQKQRALERDIRAAKRQAQYALTSQSAAESRADIRNGQAKLRQFLADNPDLNLLRHSRREQVQFSNATINVLPYDRAMR
ncbi:phage minor capsid protein [Leifsonia sp. P73]|uniref:phage minor capsid protein n=1 Tax=Leifsonia sp. P73 TaxID=3423959 RepID=UPI003DA5CCE0